MNRRTHAVVILAIAALVGQLGLARPASAEGQSSKALVGAWLIDAVPAQDIVPPFKMLMTFHGDGTLVETQNDLLALPFFGTTGHGVWQRVGQDEYSFTMLNLLFDPNFTGALVGTLKTRGTLTMHGGKDFSGTVAVTIADADGNVLFEGGGTIDGTRIQLEP